MRSAIFHSSDIILEHERSYSKILHLDSSLTWFVSCGETALYELSDIVATSAREEDWTVSCLNLSFTTIKVSLFSNINCSLSSMKYASMKR